MMSSNASPRNPWKVSEHHRRRPIDPPLVHVHGEELVEQRMVGRIRQTRVV